jgi:hypothetical protein
MESGFPLPCFRSSRAMSALAVAAWLHTEGTHDDSSRGRCARSARTPVPAYPTAQRSFRVATIVVSMNRPLKFQEMAFYDHLAVRAESPRALKPATAWSEFSRRRGSDSTHADGDRRAAWFAAWPGGSPDDSWEWLRRWLLRLTP